MTFHGFPAEAFEFYEGLLADNSKTYWTAHRDTYERCVREPLEELIGALQAEFGPGRLFRPYRDVRYARDKSPYKTWQAALVAVGEGIGYYVHLDATGLYVGGGFHHHAPEQVERYRQAVDSESSGKQLQTIVDEVVAAGFELGGDRLKTRPRGYDPDHPRIDLLRHKSLTAGRLFAGEPWLETPEAAERIRGQWRLLTPLIDWIATYVGTPDQR
jgi:uncharacterized protein (TIGR02453 family)